MQRFFFALIPALAVGFASCSSSDDQADAAPEPTGAREITIDKSGKNNPFAFKKEDVAKDAKGNYSGGKRSRYDGRAASAYATANNNLPAHMQKSYHKKAWNGSQNYATGSYQTKGYGQKEKRSWWGGKKSSSANKVANAAGRSYNTGSYRTGSANETGRRVKTGNSAYVEGRAADGFGRDPVIISKQEHRRISMGQAKSLLGR